MNAQKFPILQKLLKELELSNEFKEMAFNNNFKSLKDILHTPVPALLMHDGFTQHCYQELRDFLGKHDAVHLLKTEPSQLS